METLGSQFNEKIDEETQKKRVIEILKQFDTLMNTDQIQ